MDSLLSTLSTLYTTFVSSSLNSLLSCGCWESKAFLTLAAGVVALFVVRFVLCTVSVFWTLVRPSKNVRKFGQWAVVTGATDGIGYGFCEELAKRGLNVVLVSRSQERLEESAKKLSAKFSRIETRVVQADMASGEQDMYARIATALNGLDIGVLVNNVGCSYPHAEYLHLIEDELTSNLIELNVNAATQMTRIVLPGMVKNKRGAIVNISSAAGYLKTGDPLYAIYSGTKAYLDFFSRSLHYELASKGVSVQCLVPYFVTSKLSKIRHTSITTPSPRGFAIAAVNSIGYEATHVPYWAHRLQDAVMQSLPTWLLARLVLNHHHGIRARALKKKAQAAKQE